MIQPGVICCGNTVFDTIIKPVDELDWAQTTTLVDAIEYRCGGSAASTARALAILGIPVRLMTTVGSDYQARFVLEAIRSCGVDADYVSHSSAPTAATVVLVNSAGERKFFHRPGASSEAFVDDVRFETALCAGMWHIHLAGIFLIPCLRSEAPRILREAHVNGLTTSLDTNWDPQGVWIEILRPCLPHLDLLFMNESEARMITGHSGVALSARSLLAQGVRTCVVKLGSQGCAIYTADSEMLCAAFDIDVQDTTGAGDCFVGGFLAARQRGASLHDAGMFANAVAALSVQKVGAVEGLLPVSETEEWMRNTPLREVTIIE